MPRRVVVLVSPNENTETIRIMIVFPFERRSLNSGKAVTIILRRSERNEQVVELVPMILSLKDAEVILLVLVLEY